jgi:ABC transport system ATP-binding/permease protein
MAGAAPPALTVRYEASQRTFAPGNDVVVGRDLRADVRVGHPLISRAHLLLRFDQGRWIAVDNGSLNGMYVNNRRVPMVDIQDGQRINIGNPDGPLLTFEVGRHHGMAGRPPTMSIPLINLPGATQPPRGTSPTGTSSTGPSRVGQPQQPGEPTSRLPLSPVAAAVPERAATGALAHRAAARSADLPASHAPAPRGRPPPW